MAKLKLNSDGHVIDAEGNVIKIGDEPLTLADIEGAKTQKDIDDTVESRLARERERIKAIQAQANRTPELEKELETAKAEAAELEKRVADVRESAKAEAEQQLGKLKSERDKYRADLEAERAGRVRDQVATAILAAAKDRFNDPATDVVPHLLNAHKREPRKDGEGKDTGEYLDFFKVKVAKPDTDNEFEEKYLAVDQALEAWGAAHPHHLRASGANGSGGGQYGPANMNLKRGSMTAQQKADFISKHGVDAFKKLAL